MSFSLTIYIGLFLDSKYALDKYWPIIPKENNWIPLTIKIIQTRDGQPLVGSPKINVLKIKGVTIYLKDISQGEPVTLTIEKDKESVHIFLYICIFLRYNEFINT